MVTRSSSLLEERTMNDHDWTYYLDSSFFGTLYAILSGEEVSNA